MRSSANRRRRDTKRPAVVVAQASMVLALMGLLVAIGLRAPRGVPFLGFTTYYAEVPDVANLRIHSEVRVYGVRVGEVTAVNPSDAGTRVRLKLDPGTKPLPESTKARVRGKGLIGARYVELQPGTGAAAAEEGSTFVAARDSLGQSVTDAIDTFDKETRGGLANTITGLGQGTLGRGEDLNRAIGDANPAARDFSSLVGELDRRPGALRRFVPSADAASTAVDSARDDLVQMMAPTARALDPFVDRREPVRDALDAAAVTTRVAPPAFDDTRRLIGAVRRVAVAADGTLPEAPAALQATTKLLRTAPGPLRKATPLIRDDVRPASRAVRGIAKALSPVLQPTKGALGDLAPLLTLLGEYRCDLVNTMDNWASLTGQGAPGGGLIGPLTALRVEVVHTGQPVSGIGGAPSATDRNEPLPAACVNSVPPPIYDGLGIGENG